MTKIRKIALSLPMFFVIFGYGTAAKAANQKVDPPLRMAPDRKELINMLSDEKLLQAIHPMDENFANKLKEENLDTQKMKEMPPHDPKIMYRMLDFNPKKPIAQQGGRTIYLSPDYSTTLMFLDRDGKKWPIKNYTISLGDKIINSVVDTGTFVLQPKTQFAKGNMVVMLKGEDVPVTLTIYVGDKKLDYTTKVQVDEYGPNSQPTFSGNEGDGSIQTNDLSSMSHFTKSDMLLMLQGYTPDKSYKSKKTNDNDVQVWEKDKIMFVRTQDELISPSLVKDKNNRVTDVNGNKVFAIPYTPSIMLMRQGKYIEVQIR